MATVECQQAWLDAGFTILGCAIALGNFAHSDPALGTHTADRESFPGQH